jgi:hypothetical protein
VFSLHDYDLALWHSRANVPCWPIAKGRFCRDDKGRLGVELDVEQRPEWTSLRQHLPDDPLWNALSVWKQAMCKDMRARTDLLRWTIERIESPISRGGLGLPVFSEIASSTAPTPSVSLYYAFHMADRMLSMVLGVRTGPHGVESFSNTMPGILSLEGRPAIRAEDPDQIETAKDFLIQTEARGAGHKLTKAAAEAYRTAGQRTEELHAARTKIQSAAAFPAESLCDDCRTWATAPEP